MRPAAKGPAALIVGIIACVLTAGAASAEPGSTVQCRFTDERFTEISGMTYSQLHPNVLYLHNDSGGGPRIYAVDSTTCRTLATLTIAGAQARDFEAIGSGSDRKGRPILWVGDIGDNRDSWPEVSLLRVREPKVLRDGTLSARTYRVRYQDRPHNAEALLTDPTSLKVWIVTKQSANGGLYALPSRMSGRGINVATRVRGETGMVTDGAVSPDGTRYALRDYVDAQVFTGLPPGRDPQTVYLPLQLQGEAMTWTTDGSALLVASEGERRLLRVDIIPTDAAADPASTDPAPADPVPTDSAPADPAAGSPSPLPSSVQSSPPANADPGRQVPTQRMGAGVAAAALVIAAGAVIAIAEVLRRRGREPDA